MVAFYNRLQNLLSLSVGIASKAKLVWRSILFSVWIRLGNYGKQRLIKGKSFRVKIKINDQKKAITLRTQDMPLFSEILVDKSYLPSNDLASEGYIIDLGANIGLTAILIASHYPNNPLIAIEPSRKNITYLEQNLKHINNATTIHAAIDQADGTVGLFDSGLGYNSTITEDKSDYQVRSISMNSLLNSNDIHRISLLKCDIEGAEELIFNEDASWLQVVDNLAIEIHRQAFVSTITNILKMKGLIYQSKNESIYWFRRKTC